jgi:hypothetical protein
MSEELFLPSLPIASGGMTPWRDTVDCASHRHATTCRTAAVATPGSFEHEGTQALTEVR